MFKFVPDKDYYANTFRTTPKDADGRPITGDDYAPETLADAQALDKQSNDSSLRHNYTDHAALFFHDDYFIDITRCYPKPKVYEANLVARRWVERHIGTGKTQHEALVDCLTKFVASQNQIEMLRYAEIGWLGDQFDHDNIGLAEAIDVVLKQLLAQPHPKMRERIKAVKGEQE